MRVAVLLCAFVAVTSAVTEDVVRRNAFTALLAKFGLDTTALQQDLQILLDKIGTDDTEQQCEAEVHKLFADNVLTHSAALLCHSFQDLVQHFHLTPDATSTTVGRRNILTNLLNNFGLNTTILKADLQIMLDVIGTDATEQACEQEGHKLFSQGLLSHSVPLICHSFQELVHHFHETPDSTATAVGKRNAFTNLLANFGLDTTALQQDLQILLDKIGTDDTEQACEAEVHKLFADNVLTHSAALLCHSFQELVQHFHLTPDATSTAVGRRNILTNLLNNFGLNTTILKADLQIMLDVIGTDATEQACEQEGHKLFSQGLLSHSVPLICHSFQELVHHFHEVPDSGTTTVGKRNAITNLLANLGLNTAALQKDLQLILDVIGNDATEQACEAEVHKLFANNVLTHGAPLLCHSFQELVHHFHLTPDSTSTAVGRRNLITTLLANFGLNTTILKADLQIMLDVIGTDATEQACEQEGHKLFSQGLLSHSVPLICHSFQELVHHFHEVPDSGTTAVGKRNAITNLLANLGLNTAALQKDLQLILDVIGNDATEQACEAEVHKLFANNVLTHGAPLLCHSFQELVHHFHLTPDSTSTAVGRRNLITTLLANFGLNTTILKADLQIMLDVIGTDATEQACEQEGHKLFSQGLLSHSVPLICHSFQELVHHFHETPDSTATAVGKRNAFTNLLANLGLNTGALQKDLQLILDVIGNDATEQACEAEVHKLFANNVLTHGAPLLCHSFQELVSHFHLTPDATSTTVGRRNLLTNLLNNFGLNTTILKADIQIMLDVIGTDATEQACEQEGHKLFSQGLLSHSVPLICHSFQELVHHFHEVPDSGTTAVGKRNAFTNILANLGLNTAALQKDLQLILDVIGNDATEQACEAEVHKLFANNVLTHGAPLLCHSFQELVSHFHLTPDATSTAVGRRNLLTNLLNNFGLNTTILKADIQIMLDVIGTDATEQACEQEGHKLFSQGLLSHSVPLICHSFQELVHHFHEVPDSGTTAVGKRNAFTNLLANFGLDTTALQQDLQILLDKIGTDDTEQACEAEVHKLFADNVLTHSAALLCHSFQELVQHFHLTPDATSTAVGKRNAFTNLLAKFGLDTTALQQDLQILLDVIGTDDTEQACEAEVHKLFADNVLTHSAALLCHSFQELVHHFHLTPDSTSTTVGRRNILNNLLHSFGNNYLGELQHLVASLGSDPTEAACEQAFHQYAPQYQTFGPEVCKNIDSLIHQFQLVAVGK